MPKNVQVQPISAESLRHIAAIIPEGAAAAALREFERRRAANEDVSLYRDVRRSTILVGPTILPNAA